ncbi:MAG TPA: flagellar hook-associated protein FlgK [Pseudomonas xinjiangensis]|uniref:Flagellar hook-associated protein 1 n=2 Tax=root TaxID=1 RepID=A0A7V1BQU3_9GAMM|nr:flagellar hook-associated protein FlgK [Halopseudomonas xinjiangensis]HEC46203.1 flagellar hook-associated protein FlgK [Halopseudomonas xinjiangensis]
MADLFNIGLSGLKASQTNLSVTGQNITNINTPGYSRQTALQTARDPSFTGAGYIGSGTSIVDVKRVYNEFLTSQVRASTSINTEVAAFQTQIEELNGLLSSPATGINPGMQSYFAALQTAIEDPANLPARQLFLSEAEGLASKFNTIQDRLAVQNQFIGQQMGSLTQEVSRLATSIASFNDSIAKAAANGAQPNDLLDARDEAVRQLSEHIGVTVVPQDGNVINLFIGSGQPLVVGNQASSLTTAPGQADPGRTEVLLVSGSTKQDITGLIKGGELGGLIRYRRDVLDQSLNAVGRLALSISSEVNSQLGQGLDVNGKPGSNLFIEVNSPEQVALRSQAQPTNSVPMAQLNVSITDTSALTTSDYEVAFTNSTEFTLRRLSDNQPSGPFTLGDQIEGFTLDAATIAPQAGDRFLITPTRYGAGGMGVEMKDPRQLAFASPVAAQAGLDNRGSALITQPELTMAPGSDVTGLVGGADPLPFSFVAGAGNTFDVVRDVAGTPTVVGTASPVDGVLTWAENGYSISVNMTGSAQQGDRFDVALNKGSSDNRNALKLSNLQTDPVLGVTADSKGFSFVDGYGDLVQRTASFTAQARSEVEATGAVLRQATNNRDSVSAVNLDEEASNLIKYEQYYNASAQVIQIARSIFDTLISSIR